MSDSSPARDPSIPESFEVLGEHYRLVRKLGEGAFGVVYEAEHDLLGQSFAVKILKPELCEDENVRDRFLDEARALIRFSHANVVQLRHVGEHRGRLYLVMDLVKGEGLNDLVRRSGPLPEDRAVDLIQQLLAGLEAAHAAGIIHRDLKPSNLIVDQKPGGGDRVRILDFGLSKLSPMDGAQSAHRSVTGAIIGTLAYMSPEQLSGEEKIDARSDIFASGLILHELLEGRHPYPGDSGIVVAAKLLREPVPDLDPKRAGKLSDATRSALRTALERDRDARFASAVAFGQALEGKGPPSDTSRLTTIQDAKEALARAEARDKRVQGEQQTAKNKSLLMIGGIAIALIAVAAGLFFAFGNQGDDGDGATVAKTPTSSPAADPATDHAPEPAQPRVPAVPSGTSVPEAVPVEEPAVPPPPPVAPTPVPAPVTPEPATPEPATPATVPAVPEVVTPEPAAAEPAAAEPAAAEPAAAEPAATEPVTPQPAATSPATTEPVTTEPATTEPAPALGPKETAAKASALAKAGSWMAASAAWQEANKAEPMNVDALRGAAMTWLEGADALARKGRVDEAIASLDGLITWLTKEYKQVYEPASVRDQVTTRRPMGFALTHRGEAWTERARWLRVKGDRQGEKDALARAEADLRLAWQSLDRDGVAYWDFLLRRAELHRMRGNWNKYIEDLALTTQINSDQVPPRMWVAHFTGLRRQAERVLLAPRREGAGGPRRRPGAAKVPRRGPANRAEAEQKAKDALLLAKTGESWTRQRGEAFTREQWMQAARVIVTNCLARPRDADRTDLQGLMGWYVKQAHVQPAPAWQSAELAEARLLPLDAALATLESKQLRRRGQTAEAGKKLAEAHRLATRAVALQEKIGAEGGPLPEVLPYVMLSLVLREQEDMPGAIRSIEAARNAGKKNPE